MNSKIQEALQLLHAAGLPAPKPYVEPSLEPEVGMGATGGCGSDCYPYTVVEVRSSKEIVVQGDNHKVVSGSEQDGSANYEYSPNPQAGKMVVTRRKNGRWIPKGRGIKEQGIYLGNRRYYYDPHR